jgi:hypothetical protein
MKKITFVLLLLTLFVLPLSAQSPKKTQAGNQKSWSLVFIPDIQNYSKRTCNQPILDLMLAWVEDHIDSLNIKMVMCPGDLVEYNDWIINTDDGNVPTREQWAFVGRAFDRLNGKVPYILSTGNHDYSYTPQGDRLSSLFPEYITPERNLLNQKYLCQAAPNCEGHITMENSAFRMAMPDGKDYLFLSLEYAPRDTIIRWANNVVNLPKYKDDRIVVLTHSYINTSNDFVKGKAGMINPSVLKSNYRRTKALLKDANNGLEIWDKLIKPNNIEMVLCGHIMGVGYRNDKNAAGKNVHEVLFDTQSEGGGHRHGNGGDGWMRIMEFSADGKTVSVKTFSPLFGCSPSTRHLADKHDSKNEFSFSFDD